MLALPVDNDALMNRWNYVKDLREFSNAGELLASYAKNTRRNVKIARNSGAIDSTQ